MSVYGAKMRLLEKLTQEGTRETMSTTEAARGAGAITGSSDQGEATMTKTPDDFLGGEAKPSVNQTAWVFAHLFDHMADGGSFGYLIYNRMGHPMGSRCVLQPAGGLAISNAMYDAEEYVKLLMRKKLKGRRAVRRKHYLAREGVQC